MTDIAAALLAVSLMTGLPVPPPPTVIESRDKMPCVGEHIRNPIGLYCMGFVWLRDDATQAVAVHEMVHHFQHHYRAEMLEMQAYQLERKWSKK